jgi:hypothetical protein
MTISFISPTGDNINFKICDFTSEWNEVGGIYMFCRRVVLLNGCIIWMPVYIGKTNNFKIRLPSHEKWEKAIQLGAVKVLAVVEESEYRRSLLEFQLIQHFDPPLNKQLRPSPNNHDSSPMTQAYSIPMSLGMSLVPQIHQHPANIGMSLLLQTHQNPKDLGLLGSL